ncbi:MAG: NIPSNAP family protein [Rectinemataceae bacterium]
MKALIEIRTLNIRPGRREEFHRLFTQDSLPLLKRWKLDVVAHAPSLHDKNTYYVIRRFDSLARREQSEDAFYGSDDWIRGPREAMLALIENYTDIVLELDEATIQGLRK